MNAGINAPSTVMRKMVLLMLLIGSLGAQAQVRLGILGGLHSSNVLGTNSIPGYDTATMPYLNSRFGFQLGFILEVPIGHSGFYFQPGFTYITKGQNYKRNNVSFASLLSDSIYNRATLNLSYIVFPLNLTYKIPLTANHKNQFFVSAGPYVSFFYSGNVTTSSLTQNPEQFSSQSNPVTVGKGPDTYKTMDLGVNGRAGFELNKMMISAYFSRGLTSFYNADYPGTFHHQVFGISLGIWIASSGIPEPDRKVVRKPVRKAAPPPARKAAPAPVRKAAPPSPVRKPLPVLDLRQTAVDNDQDSCKLVPASRAITLPHSRPGW